MRPDSTSFSKTEVLSKHQNLAELDAFCEAIRGASSFLEIGSKYGASLWHIAKFLKDGARTVSVDLPHGVRDWEDAHSSLRNCCLTLCERGFDARVIWGDSTSLEVVEQVRNLGPFDLTFIDANHSREFVEKDWVNYGPMSRLVAFHDVSASVEPFWCDLKKTHKHQEFRLETGRNGIGLVWTREI